MKEGIEPVQNEVLTTVPAAIRLLSNRFQYIEQSGQHRLEASKEVRF